MKLARTTVSLAVLLLLGACASPPPAGQAAPALKMEPVLRAGATAPSAEQAYAAGRQALAEQRPATALAWFDLALAARPASALALNGRAVALARLGRPAAAVPVLEQALRLEPQAAYLHANLARVLARAGDPARALQSLAQAQRLAPGDAELQALAETLQQRIRSADSSAGAAATAAAPAAAPAAAVPPPVGTAPGSASSRWVEVAPGQFELRPLAPPQQTAATPAAAAPPALPAVMLEISNGAGERGLARRTAQRLAAQGARPARVTNHAHFRVTQTRVEHLPAQQAAADAVARSLGLAATLVPTEALAPGVSVRVVLGQDARGTALAAVASRAL